MTTPSTTEKGQEQTKQVATEQLELLADEEVVKLIIERKNPEYFEVIYERYARRVYNKCLGFTYRAQAAEDLAHDILLKSYLSLSRFSFKSKFSTWLYSITYNACVDWHKKNHRISIELEKIAYDDVGIVEPFKESEQELLQIQAARLKQLMEKLGVDEKVVLLQKYQDDLSIKEIADAMELSESAVKMRLKRGRDKLLEMYSREYGGEAL